MNFIKIILVVCINFIFQFTLNAQDLKFNAEFKKGLIILDSATTTEDFSKAIKKFENSLTTDKKNWLTYYYLGISNSVIAFHKKGKEVDDYCDKAEKYCNKADSLQKNNSEIYVLKSMIEAARIAVNPIKRGQKHSSLSAKYNVQALKFNPNNPRAHLQKARAILNTPLAIGGGPKKAKPLYEAAIEKYKTFKPEHEFFPNWGLKEAKLELKKINQ